MMIKLAVKDLCFSYQSVDALQGLSLNIDYGQIVSIVGSNGSGKSTLLKCIDRILVPSSGSITVDGREAIEMDRMEMARMMAYVPQNSLRVFPNTVFDIVLMGRRPYVGWKMDREDREKAWEVLQLLGIEELALNPFTELSGGQQQKVVIARALAQETEVVLLDEPTSNLDVWHQIDVMEILRTLVRKRGLTAIIAIHDLNMAARYSDRMLMMKKGRIVAGGKPAAVMTRENLEAIYGIKADVRFTEDTPFMIPLARIPKTTGSL
jgi:iron complex transport system ATP-binding protein